MKLRETSNPIGLKFHQVMKEKGLIANYAAVAKAFEVATTSVYDWVDHGRISKERYRHPRRLFCRYLLGIALTRY